MLHDVIEKAYFLYVHAKPHHEDGAACRAHALEQVGKYGILGVVYGSGLELCHDVLDIVGFRFNSVNHFLPANLVQTIQGSTVYLDFLSFIKS